MNENRISIIPPINAIKWNGVLKRNPPIPDKINVPGAEHKDTGIDGTFLVVDYERVLFCITGDETHHDYDTAIWVDSPILARIFEQTFNTAWGKGVEARLKVNVNKKKVEA